CYSYVIKWQKCGDGYCGEMDFVPCGSPTPTPTPTPTATPPPDCSLLGPPPNQSCQSCSYQLFGNLDWDCEVCYDSIRADFPRYGQTGCPDYMYLQPGSFCCVCADQSPC